MNSGPKTEPPPASLVPGGGSLRVELHRLDVTGVNRVEPRARAVGLLSDGGEVVSEASDLLTGLEVPVGQAEHPQRASGHELSLARPPTDPIVFAGSYPASLVDMLHPVGVGHLPQAENIVQRTHWRRPVITKEPRHSDSAEAPINEQIRRQGVGGSSG